MNKLTNDSVYAIIFMIKINEKGERMSVVKKRVLLGISIIVLLVFCMGAFVMPQKASATQIVLPYIQNNDFEQGAVGWQISAQNIDDEKHGITAQKFYGFANSYQFRENQYSIKSSDYIAVDENAEYIVGVKALSTELNNEIRLSIEVFDQNDALLYTMDGETFAFDKTGVWQDQRLNFQTSQNACRIKIKMQISSTSGEVCIDSVYAHKNFAKALDGASINLETTPTALENKGQLRFTGKLDRDAFDDLTSVYPGAVVGFMLMPTSHVETLGEYTVKGVADANRSQSLIMLSVAKWSNLYTIEEDGCYIFDCAIRGMSGQSIKSDISVRVFVKYYDNGQEKYLYSNYSQELNSRSVYSVAVMAKADTQTYNSYSEGQKEKINAYIEGREPNLENLD